MKDKDFLLKTPTEILQARLEELRAENVRLLLKQDQLILENFEKDKLLVEALAEKKQKSYFLLSRPANYTKLNPMRISGWC